VDFHENSRDANSVVLEKTGRGPDHALHELDAGFGGGTYTRGRGSRVRGSLALPPFLGFALGSAAGSR